MQVLITGGTGFIGSRLALKCLERGDVVRVLGQENNAAEAENRRLIEARGAQVILGSVTDRDRTFEVIHGVDCVYHLAAAQHEANVPNQRFWDVNVAGTKNILEASLEAGVKRFVHGSTIGVYGPAPDGVITESSPLIPDNIYGVTKLEGERLVRSFAEKLPVVVIRISETYGPGDRRLLKLFKTIKKKMFVMIGPGSNLHHPIYIDDLTDALILAATSEKALGEIVVVAGKDYVTTSEMVNLIARELGVKISNIRIPFRLMLSFAILAEKLLRPMGIQPPIHRRRLDFFRKRFRFSPGEAFDHLGFLPKYTFAQGVQETAQWYREMGFLGEDGSSSTKSAESIVDCARFVGGGEAAVRSRPRIELTAKIEPFDSFWEAPEDIEKGYSSFYKFYQHNYLKHIPADTASRILVISCGGGYFVNLLKSKGYHAVLGIDSYPEKVEHATKRGLNCVVAHAFDFLEENMDPFDVIFVEQEINHLTKREILEFLRLCWKNLKDDGTLLVHSLNGANPITGAEALAQNFDHYNTFTEYSLRQILGYSNFHDIKVIPLNLYVFYTNPLNYVGIVLNWINTFIFRLNFKVYGKFNTIFTKKIAAICKKHSR